jgi:hypothetical protein
VSVSRVGVLFRVGDRGGLSSHNPYPPPASDLAIIPTPSQTGPVGIPILPGSGRRQRRRPALVLPRRFVGLGDTPRYFGTRRRSGKPRPAPVSRPGAWQKSSGSDPKTEAVRAGCGDRDDQHAARERPGAGLRSSEVAWQHAAVRSDPGGFCRS